MLGNPHVRFDERDVEPGAMVGPLRHRQTKGAETDMPGLPPPRHIPTLPDLAVQRRSLEWRVCAVEPPFIGPRVIDRARPERTVTQSGASPAARTRAAARAYRATA